MRCFFRIRQVFVRPFVSGFAGSLGYGCFGTGTGQQRNAIVALELFPYIHIYTLSYISDVVIITPPVVMLFIISEGIQNSIAEKTWAAYSAARRQWQNVFICTILTVLQIS
ncbi:hypothetical protein GDO81_019027 [Engystomops pustulosus]|uniref:Uncharacterized protein n=1 Tax=Engystomops pustulosus TaxID=76066 RepID=A0AAV6ZKF4_ENGPU|nr:hypothetical protein GDO81_019027 [Engystomops pustulosus]